MGRVLMFKQLAISMAMESNCRDQHGAVIAQGPHVYAQGTNTSDRTAFLGKIDICQHAEMDAITIYMNQYIRRLPPHKRERKMRKTTIWCFKRSVTSQNHVGMSLPCEICLHRIKELGIRRIAFSNRDGSIEMHHAHSLTNSHQSLVQKKYADFIRW
jgi:deoxycytidylate deaminase